MKLSQIKDQKKQLIRSPIPNDTIVIADAHQYLLEHFQEFDFIWSSPPCPSHSRIRKAFGGKNPPVFPDMKLYEEILFLQGYFKGLWCVENVLSWYEPLIKPNVVANHYFWTNFLVRDFVGGGRAHDGGIKKLEIVKGFNLEGKTGIDKRKILRNCVEPELGKHIFNFVLNPIKLQRELL